MADPFSLAAASAGSSMIGGAISAGGSILSGQSQSAMYGYQAGVAQLNQKIALQNADYTRIVGGSANYKQGLTTGATLAAEKSGQSASGLDVNSGSGAAVRSSTTQLGQYDESVMATNYAKKAYDYDVEAASKGAEASADLIAGKNAVTASYVSAAGSILGTAGSVSSKWLQGSSAFGGPSQGITTYDPDMQASGWQA